MRLPWLTRADPQLGIGDPALAEYLGIGSTSLSGVRVDLDSALGLSGVWRCVALIAGVVGALPLKTYREVDGVRERVSSWVDSPHPDMTAYEWKELVAAHLLLGGNAYLLHIYGGAGQIVGLSPVPPSSVTVKVDPQLGKVFEVTLKDGTRRLYTSVDLTHIPGLSYDGIKGLSPITVARHSLGTAIAGERAAAKMWKNGLLLGGIMSAKETLTKTQAAKVLSGLTKRTGADGAGDIAFLPAAVDFRPWTMNALDAQFLESRHFSIEEQGRWFGVPRELLNESGASSWGSGIQELVRAMQRFALAPWTTRIDQRLSRLLPRPQFCEFDYSGFLQPSPESEIDLLIRQVQVGLLTINEARAIRNLPPIEAPTPEEEAAADLTDPPRERNTAP